LVDDPKNKVKVIVPRGLTRVEKDGSFENK